MLRRTFNFVALASLGALVVIGLLGWRSIEHRDYATFVRTILVFPRMSAIANRPDWVVKLRLEAGSLYIESTRAIRSRSQPVVAPAIARQNRRLIATKPIRWSATLGSVRLASRLKEPDERLQYQELLDTSAVVIPLIAPCCIALVPPLIWLGVRRRAGLRAMRSALRPRIVWNALTIVSLAGLVSIAVIWPWSYFTCIAMRSYKAPAPGTSMMNWNFANGALHVRHWSAMWPSEEPVDWSVWSIDRFPIQPPLGRPVLYMPSDGLALLGLRIGKSFKDSARTAQDVSIPAWPLAALCAVMPTRRAIGFVRRKRQTKAGSCVACGYDLRATPDRCPECGTVPHAVPVPQV